MNMSVKSGFLFVCDRDTFTYDVLNCQGREYLEENDFDTKVCTDTST